MQWTYRGGAGRVLGGTTCDVGDVGVGDDVVVAVVGGQWGGRGRGGDVHRHVLVLCEDGVVGAEGVLLEVGGSLRGADGDVELRGVSGGEGEGEREGDVPGGCRCRR